MLGKIYIEFFYQNKIIPVKKLTKDCLDSVLTLEEIFEDSKINKRNCLLYKIVFNDETVFPELLKNIPNEAFLTSKNIRKLTKKIKKEKKQTGKNPYKCKRSIFSNSKIENDLFSLDKEKSNAFQDTFNNFSNREKYQNFNSINLEEKSLSFMKLNSNYNFQKHNSNSFRIENFNNFNHIININDMDKQDKKNNKNDINIKQTESEFPFEDIIDSEEEKPDFVNKNSCSNKTKNSQNYEEGLKLFYDKIKIFN
jgi:hypothetical protein